MLDNDPSVSPTEENNSGMVSDTGVSYESSTDTHQADANPNSTESSSSSENDAKSAPQKLEDVVSAALKGKEGSSTSGQSGDQKSKTGIADPKAAQSKDQQPKDGNGQDEIPMEFHKHPAWQKLKKQRDEARAEVDQFRADSQEYNVITGFMEQHSISPVDVAETLKWLALRNNDPAQFARMISDFSDALKVNLGFELPPELKARVESGEISEEDAKALAQSKAEARIYKSRSAQQAQQVNTQREAQVQQQTSQQMADTVNKWEAQISVRDPDYQAKRRLVQSEIRAYIQQNGMPQNAAGALQYAEAAYKAVTEHLAEILPRRKPNDPSPQGGKQVETNFVPKSLEDVVSHALSGGG